MLPISLVSGSVDPEGPDTGLRPEKELPQEEGLPQDGGAQEEGVPQDGGAQEPAARALHIICVMVPMGQYTHQERGRNRTMVARPRMVDVSMTL
jgi:hypothetical protein